MSKFVFLKVISVATFITVNIRKSSSILTNTKSNLKQHSAKVRFDFFVPFQFYGFFFYVKYKSEKHIEIIIIA